MPQREVTGNRPSNFSRWHREKLPARCHLADVDWAEVREGRVVAFLETIELTPDSIEHAGEWVKDDPWLHNWYPTKDYRYPLWETKKVVINYLIGKTNIPFFIIYHLPDMLRVKVIDYRKKLTYDFKEKAFEIWLASKW